AMLTYGLIFAAQQTLNFAAEGAARAALQWQPGELAVSRTARAQQAQTTALDLASWVNKLAGDNVLSVAVCDTTGTLSSIGVATCTATDDGSSESGNPTTI